MRSALVQVGVMLALCVCIFFMGWYEGFESAQKEYQKVALEASKKAREEEAQKAKENAEIVSKFTQQIHALEARNRSLSSTASRLSERLRSAGLSASDSSPGGSCGERLAECRRLLGEGLELLSEGSGLAERIAARKDAVANLTR